MYRDLFGGPSLDLINEFDRDESYEQMDEFEQQIK